MRRVFAAAAIFAVSCVRGDPPPNWGPSSAQLRTGALRVDGRDRTFLFSTQEKVGRHRRYRLRPKPLFEVDVWLRHYREFWRTRLGAFAKLLDEES